MVAARALTGPDDGWTELTSSTAVYVWLIILDEIEPFGNSPLGCAHSRICDTVALLLTQHTEPRTTDLALRPRLREDPNFAAESLRDAADGEYPNFRHSRLFPSNRLWEGTPRKDTEALRARQLMQCSATVSSRPAFKFGRDSRRASLGRASYTRP